MMSESNCEGNGKRRGVQMDLGIITVTVEFAKKSVHEGSNIKIRNVVFVNVGRQLLA